MLFTIREMEIRNTMRYYYMHIRMTKIKKTISSVGAESQQLETPYMAKGNAKYHNAFVKKFGCSLKSLPHTNYMTKQCHSQVVIQVKGKLMFIRKHVLECL